MKKQLLFIALSAKELRLLPLLLLLAASCPAQKLYPLDKATDSLRIRVVAAQNRLALEWLDREPGGKGRKRDFMTITDLRLDDADLVLDYAPDKVRKGFLLAVSLGLRPDGGDDIFEPPTSETPETDLPTGKRITLLDGTERTLELGRTYTLYVQKNLLGPVACDKPRPVFSAGQQLPYYGVAVAGGTCIGLAVLYASQSRRAYDDYTRLWAAGAGGEQNSEAQRYYAQADDKKKSARIYGWTGAAILAADAFFFGKKWLRIRERQRIYDQFCGKKPAEIGFAPTSLGGSGVGVGLRFSW